MYIYNYKLQITIMDMDMNINFIDDGNIEVAKKTRHHFQKVYADNIDDQLNIKNVGLCKNKSRRRKMFLTSDNSAHRNRLARDRLRIKLMERNNL